MMPVWLTLALSVPVLLLGEWLVRRIGILSRFTIPAAVVGGLVVSVLVLALRLGGFAQAAFETRSGADWWNWIVSAGPPGSAHAARSANLPFLVAFFTCIGLNASWQLLRQGSVQVLKFLALALGLAVLQNCLGVVLAKAMGLSPLLGLVCGSLTMTGGHGTALGFANEFERAGLAGAGALGMAAATFGLVAGGLLGGPVGGTLIRKRRLTPLPLSEAVAPAGGHPGPDHEPGFLSDLRSLRLAGSGVVLQLLLVLFCVKAGAWFSYLAQAGGLTFPVYMGAMVLAVILRNTFDWLLPGLVKPRIVETLGSVFLGVFLSTALMTLNLQELAATALPMIAILSVQVGMMAVFAWFVTFAVMGRDYNAAVMAGGHCGFGLGATSNAVANMKALVERFGPAPRAFLVIPVVGAFLIDLFNAINITLFLNLVT